MQLRMTKILILAICFLIPLSACSIMKPVSVAETQLYTLNPKNISIPHVRKIAKTILVLPTQASSTLDSGQMIYISKAHTLGFYNYHRWASPPQEQLTTLITQALQKSGRFRAAVNAPFIGVTDFRLNTRLVKLQQDFTRKPSRIQMSLQAQLVNASTGKVIGENQWTVTVSAHQDNPYGGVIAANKATAILLKNLVQFCVRFS